MIQLIKYLVTGVILLSCKDFSDKNNFIAQGESVTKIEKSKDNEPKNDIVSKNDKLDINGVWKCYKFIVDEKSTDKGEISFAEEMSKYIQLKIEDNKLTFKNCKKELYTYKYPVKLKKFEDESIFIKHFKPKNDSVYFVGSINSGESDAFCDLFDTYTFYLADNGTIIQYYRGYFFYYKKSSEAKETKENGNFEINGIPGNNKNEWVVKGTMSYSSSLESDYESFKKYFPYGSKNLSQKIPVQKDFVDKINGITYQKTSSGLEIVKDDPLGKIYINFTKSSEKSNFKYEFRYPEY